LCHDRVTIREHAMPFATVDPTTGRTVATFDAHDDAEVQRRIAAAALAFEKHRQSSFAERARRLRRAADILESDKRRWAELMTHEMGKPITAAVAEAEKCATACSYFADHGETFLADEPVDTDAHRSFVRYQPLGIVLAIMPWNFPFWQVVRFAAPALMAGNVGLLKHAASVPQCALALEEIFRRAGFGDGEFQTLLIDSKHVEPVTRDPRIAAVTLTGSEHAGSAVARTAGEEIKKCVLELGGSDPFIVMPSADLDDAVDTAVRARTVNSGQSCIAAKRFLVHREIYDTFAARFVDAMRSLVVGDPMDEATQIGPLATEKIRDDLHDQVRRSLHAGARLLCGGEPLDRDGFFYPPTVLADIPPGSPPHEEELFGPVASLFRVEDVDHAIRLANATSFGLGSAVFTRDDSEARRFIDGIEAGLVFINAMVASDPRLPFGGVKRSGFGRELSRHGILEFVNVKTVYEA
jgi:succinate-semialdehyde dehydrogenase / glutarate-semialdehyde dehydrogenase